jgi:hypothetical protein
MFGKKKTCLLYDVEQSPPYNVFGKLLHIITTLNELSTTTGNCGLGNFTLHFSSFKFKRLIPLKFWVFLKSFWNKKTQVLYEKKNYQPTKQHGETFKSPQNNPIKSCKSVMMQLSRIWWNSSNKNIHFLEQLNYKQGWCKIKTNKKSY